MWLTVPALESGLFVSLIFWKEIFLVIQSHPMLGESGCLKGRLVNSCPLMPNGIHLCFINLKQLLLAGMMSKTTSYIPIGSIPRKKNSTYGNILLKYVLNFYKMMKRISLFFCLIVKYLMLFDILKNKLKKTTHTKPPQNFGPLQRQVGIFVKLYRYRRI